MVNILPRSYHIFWHRILYHYDALGVGIVQKVLYGGLVHDVHDGLLYSQPHIQGCTAVLPLTVDAAVLYAWHGGHGAFNAHDHLGDGDLGSWAG